MDASVMLLLFFDASPAEGAHLIDDSDPQAALRIDDATDDVLLTED